MRTPMRTLIFLLAVLTANVANGQIIVRQQEGPAVRPLPQVVQEMDAKQYHAWSEGHNTLAKQYAKEVNEDEAQYLRGWATSHAHSDRTNIVMRYRNLQGTTNTAGTSTTLEVKRRLPGQMQAVRYFNPYCKPKVAPEGTPDWDNIFAVYQNRVMSVNEIAQQIVPAPVFKEALYRQLLRLQVNQ